MSSHGKSQGRSRPGSLHARDFPFKVGDLVLVKWSDGMVYFAKIKRIDHKRRKCTVVFDDKSQDEALFNQIHSVDETTTDIICIKCKKDDSETPNEIVLCDSCGIGYHQKCHSPSIPTSALNIDTPWQCTYCSRGEKCPYLTESLDVLQNLLSEESGSEAEREEVSVQQEHKVTGTRRSRRVTEGKVNSDLRSPRPPPPSLEMRPSTLPSVDAVRHKLAALPSQSNKHTPRPTPPANITAEPEQHLATPESTPESTPEPSNDRKRRKKHFSNYSKRHKPSSVDACTLSVTSLPVSQEESGAPDKQSVTLNGVDDAKDKPRSLRVSLSIQDDTDGGVVKVKTPVTSPKTTPQATPPQVSPPMPSWDESGEEQENEVFPTVSLKNRRKASVILQAGKAVEKTTCEAEKQDKVCPAFTVSALPTSKIPDFNSIDDMFEMSPTESGTVAASNPPLPLNSPGASRQLSGKNSITEKPSEDEKRVSVVMSCLPSGAKPQPTSAPLQTTPASCTDKTGSLGQVIVTSTTTAAVSSGTDLTNSDPIISSSTSHNPVPKASTVVTKPTSLAIHTPTTKVNATLQTSSPQPTSLAIHTPTTKVNATLQTSSPQPTSLAIHTPTTKVNATLQTSSPQPTSLAVHTPTTRVNATLQTSSPQPTSLAVHAPTTRVNATLQTSSPQPTSLAVHTPTTRVNATLQTSSPHPPGLVVRASIATPIANQAAIIKPKTCLARQTPSPSASQAHISSVSNKRPWSEDVIITGVEKNVLPPAKKLNIDTTEGKGESLTTKMSTVDSPVVPRPSPHTGLVPKTTQVVLNRPVYSTVIEATPANKPQYVYRVQSPGGKSVYIPANVIQQAHSRTKDAHGGVLSPLTKPSNSPLYYTSDVVQSAPVNTTKPYAIVNALPSTPGMYPRQLAQLQPVGGEGVGPVVMTGSPVSEMPKKVVHTPSPTSTYPSSRSQPLEEMNSHLQTINKNISAAFTNLNEEMLISAFEDAWKKFQANGPRYKTRSGKVVSSRKHGPPNAEVVSIPGTVASRLSLVRSVGQRSRPVAPKVNRTCALCGREATYLCSGCRTEWYCGRECQLKAWDRHSEACKT